MILSYYFVILLKNIIIKSFTVGFFAIVWLKFQEFLFIGNKCFSHCLLEFGDNVVSLLLLRFCNRLRLNITSLKIWPISFDVSYDRLHKFWMTLKSLNKDLVDKNLHFLVFILNHVVKSKNFLLLLDTRLLC